MANRKRVGCSILLVEDDPGVQELLRHVLVDEGNEVEVARNGQEMRAALEARIFNVVIMDVRLPGPENGIALAQQVIERGCGVVLITGDHTYREALEKTGHRFLLKPFRVERLLEAAQEVVEEKKARCNVKQGSGRTG